MKLGCVASLVALCAVGLACVSAQASDPSIDKDIVYLTSHERGGRGPESRGRVEAQRYIRRAFEAAGLEPLFANSYGQSFEGEGTVWVNVGAFLPGTSPEYILVGAHYDHLATEEGIAGPVVYPGADDNASGVAALLSLARSLSKDAPGRGVAFVAFDGEEQGLLGSKYYAEHPPRDAASLVAMINFDSIGRLREDRLVVFGSGTARVFDAMLSGLNRAHGFHLALNTEGVGAGDHETFFRRGVPVLHLFTDAHLDYHRPSDTADKLNLGGIARIAALATDLVAYVRDPAVALEFIPAGADKLEPEDQPRERRRVRLGTIPDFARENGGVLISGLVPQSPAARAGLAVGDVIVRIDDTPVDNLHDYQGVLASHEPGDTITITVLRGEETLTMTATLEERGG